VKTKYSFIFNLFLFSALSLSFASAIPVLSKQDPLIDQIVRSMSQNNTGCQPNYYFSVDEIQSKDGKYAYYEVLQRMLNPQQAASKDWFSSQKDLNLMPVNACIVRGNKDFSRKKNAEFLHSLAVSKIVNLDYVSDSLNRGKTSFQYTFLPINPNAYPKDDNIRSIKLALEQMQSATPESRLYISDLTGKYQVGLVVALYQFLGDYSLDAVDTCDSIGKDRDKPYQQMNAIGNKGLLNYDFPDNFRKFYLDFAHSVCNHETDKLLAIPMGTKCKPKLK
jgi:hypothetical protein